MDCLIINDLWKDLFNVWYVRPLNSNIHLKIDQ